VKTMAIPEVRVDFSRRNPVTKRVPLSVEPAASEILKLGLGHGDRVFLCDDERGAVADIEQDGEFLFGSLVTEPFALDAEQEEP